MSWIKCSLLIMIFCIPVSCAKNKALKIKFDKKIVHLGEISPEDAVSHTFRFTNRSNNSIAIGRVQTSCGCTASEWNRNLVPQDSIGIIAVSYIPTHPGLFCQTINVFYNEEKTPIVLEINGTVLNPKIKMLNAHNQKEK